MRARPSTAAAAARRLGLLSGVARRSSSVTAPTPPPPSAPRGSVPPPRPPSSSSSSPPPGGPEGGDDPLLSLAPALRDGLRALGVTGLFPVQVQTLQSARKGKDVMIRSVTGSGKTLAFSLPLVERVMAAHASAPPPGAQPSVPRRDRAGTRPKALVLVPTRELAIQCHKVMTTLAPTMRCGLAYGGVATGDWVRYPVDVVIGTLGRVKDLTDRGVIDLSQVRATVLDEADTMLMVDSNEEVVRDIFSYLPPKEHRMNILCSASMPAAVHTVAREYMNEHDYIDLAGEDKKLPTTITLVATPVAQEAKVDALVQVLGSFFLNRGRNSAQPVRALVFTTTRQDSEDLMADERLRESKLFRCEAIHGGYPQRQRETIMHKFSRGVVNVLVSTDLTARGLDISNVDLVVHYDTPQSEDAFMHRTGRTGRAGKLGTSVLFFSPKFNLESLERAVGVRFTRRGVPSLVPTYNSLATDVTAEEAKPWLSVVDQVLSENPEATAQQLVDGVLSLFQSPERVQRDLGLSDAQDQAFFSALTGRLGVRTLVCPAEHRDQLSSLAGMSEQVGTAALTADGKSVLVDVKADAVDALCAAAAEAKFLLAPLTGDVPPLAPQRRFEQHFRGGEQYESRGYNGRPPRRGGYGGGGGGGGGGRGGYRGGRERGDGEEGSSFRGGRFGGRR